MRAHYTKTVISDTGVKLFPLTVQVYQPGTTTNITDPLFGDDVSSTPLPNPFPVADGVIDLYLDNPQRVDLSVTYGLRGPVLFENIDVLEVLTDEAITGIVLAGTTDPDPSLGDDGDFYINQQDGTQWTLFGPKAGGAWSFGYPLTVAVIPTAVQAQIAGQVAVASNAVLPGVLVTTDTEFDTMYLAVGTAPTDPFTVRVHWPDGAAETNQTSVGPGYFELTIDASNTSAQSSHPLNGMDESGNPLTTGPYIFAAGTYLRIEVVSANGAADANVALSGVCSTFAIPSS